MEKLSGGMFISLYEMYKCQNILPNRHLRTQS